MIKEYLKYVPSKYYRVPYNLFNTDCNYFTVLSSRAKGKTTNILIWCLLEYKYFGKTFVYYRDSHEEIKKSNLDTLFGVIKAQNYISEIFDNRYNDILVNRGKFLLVKLDENQKVIERSEDIGVAVCGTRHEIYKSSLNTPHCTTIIYDEFIKTTTQVRSDVFFNFFDTHNTITRKRTDVKTFFVGNNIDARHEWFTNLLIDVKKLQKGDKKMYVTSLGTKNYVEFLSDGENSFTNTLINKLYYGFNNQKLNSITGSESWSYDYYPICPYEYENMVIDYRYYVLWNNDIIELSFVGGDEFNYIYCRGVDFVKDGYDALFLDSTKDVKHDNEYKSFKKGSNLYSYINRMYTWGRLYTDTPITHNIIRKYILGIC